VTPFVEQPLAKTHLPTPRVRLMLFPVTHLLPLFYLFLLLRSA